MKEPSKILKLSDYLKYMGDQVPHILSIETAKSALKYGDITYPEFEYFKQGYVVWILGNWSIKGKKILSVSLLPEY